MDTKEKAKQAAIAKAEAMIGWNPDEYTGALVIGFDAGYSAASKDTWTKIDGPESLPKVSGLYLVTTLQVFNQRKQTVDIQACNPTNGGFFDPGVTAWMPLPSPFTEGDRDEQN